MRGIRQAIDFIYSKIEAIEPKSDIYNGFVASHKGKGGSLPLEQRQTSRLFDIQFVNYGKDDGEAGVTGRKRADINIRVLYQASADKQLLDIQISEDASLIIDALQYPSYDYLNTGILTINCQLQNSGVSSILDNNGKEQAYLLTLNLFILYREEV